MTPCHATTLKQAKHDCCFCRATSAILLCILLMRSLSGSIVYSCRYHLLCSHSHIPFNTAIAIFCCRNLPLSQSSAVTILRCRNVTTVNCYDLAMSRYFAVAISCYRLYNKWPACLMSQPSLSLCRCRDLLAVQGLTITLGDPGHIPVED
jgi:hypothetical protein